MADRTSHAPNEQTSRSTFSRFFRNPETGELAIAERPNLPLAIFLLATLARLLLHPHGAVGTAVSVISTLSIVWWSGDEILRGNSPFRRVLGALVLVGVGLGLLLR